MRLAAAVLAATLQAAGPWLCCCVAVASTPAEWPPAGRTHCCRHTPPETPKPVTPAPACPCLARMAATAPALPPDIAAVAFDAAPTWAGGGDRVSASVRSAPEVAAGSPFLTAAVRLRVHHVMHC